MTTLLLHRLAARHLRRLASRDGFTLVEITLALGIASFCLIPLIALLPVGINDGRNASEQTAALNLGSAILADLHSAPASAANTSSPRYQLTIPGATATTAASTTLYFDAGGSVSTSLQTASRYQATLAWRTPTAQTVAGTLRISWPASAAGAAVSTNAVEFPVVVNH